MGSMVTVLALDSETATNPNERMSLKPFDKSQLPQDERVYVLPEDTLLYHGAYKERADQIDQAGSVLLSRPPMKVSGGMDNEGGLIFWWSRNSKTLC